MFYGMYYPCDLGEILLGSDENNIIGLWIGNQKYIDQTKPQDLVVCERIEDVPVLQEGKAWLDAYFRGERPDPGLLPLAPAGSEFRQLIWKILLDIPYGETTTYKEIAKKAARLMGRETMSAQAVGGAIAHNPISIIIPCHRVVGTNGSLTGYAGGLAAKKYLLAHERD